MDFIDANRELSARVPKHLPHIQTYCGVLLDDNNRRPSCRIWLNGSRKYLSLFDNEQRKETKIAIEGLDDLYGFTDRLKATAAMYAN